jgi:hypothetical protein
MAAKSKQVLRQAMECEKPLRLSRGGEPSHRPFSLARRFVRDFGAVIRIDVVDVMHHRHHGPMSPYGQKIHPPLRYLKNSSISMGMN